VGDAHAKLKDKLVSSIGKIKVGDGTTDGVTMGPVISAAHRERVMGYIAKGIEEGAELVVDGSKVSIPSEGFFVGPYLFDGVTQDMTIGQEEIFGPVLCMTQVPDLDAAMAMIKNHPLANASSIFTTSGASARKFKYEVPATMAGVNIGVAAPMSYFGFGGAKGSFFGDLKAHGRESFDFYTDRKVVISRW